MKVDTITIRQAEPSDVAFIFATALRNLWYSKDMSTTLPKAKYMKLKHFQIETDLDQYMTAVACLTDDPDVILGYAINSPQPFIYVKKVWRDAGIQTKLRETLNRYNAIVERKPNEN